ncbi:MAG: hypothetical protein ACI4IG_00210 [Eubacterium sp.]
MHTEHSRHHSHNANSIEESIALLEYMAKHNSSHTDELINISKEIKNINPSAYEKIVCAIESYEKGNACLFKALSELE